MNRYYLRLEHGDWTQRRSQYLEGVTTVHDARRRAFAALRAYDRGSRCSILRVALRRGVPVTGQLEPVATVWVGPNGGENWSRAVFAYRSPETGQPR